MRLAYISCIAQKNINKNNGFNNPLDLESMEKEMNSYWLKI